MTLKIRVKNSAKIKRNINKGNLCDKKEGPKTEKKFKGGMWFCSDPSSRYSSSRKHGSEMSIPSEWTI